MNKKWINESSISETAHPPIKISQDQAKFNETRYRGVFALYYSWIVHRYRNLKTILLLLYHNNFFMIPLYRKCSHNLPVWPYLTEGNPTNRSCNRSPTLPAPCFSCRTSETSVNWVLSWLDSKHDLPRLTSKWRKHIENTGGLRTLTWKFRNKFKTDRK